MLHLNLFTVLDSTSHSDSQLKYEYYTCTVPEDEQNFQTCELIRGPGREGYDLSNQSILFCHFDMLRVTGNYILWQVCLSL
jgi:hypothetical protein